MQRTRGGFSPSGAHIDDGADLASSHRTSVPRPLRPSIDQSTCVATRHRTSPSRLSIQEQVTGTPPPRSPPLLNVMIDSRSEPGRSGWQVRLFSPASRPNPRAEAAPFGCATGGPGGGDACLVIGRQGSAAGG